MGASRQRGTPRLIHSILITFCLAWDGRVSPLVSQVPAHAAFPAENGLIAFSAETDNGVQLFTVRRNGHRSAADHGWPPRSVDTRLVPRWTVAGLLPQRMHDRADPRERDTPAHHPVTDPRRLRDRSGVHARRPPPGLLAIRPDRERRGDLDHEPRRHRRRRLGTGPGGALTPEVSPDGQIVTFLSFMPDDLTALFAVSIDGGDAWQVTPTLWGITFKHDWAPDGSRLVMSDNVGNPDRPANVLTIRPAVPACDT